MLNDTEGRGFRKEGMLKSLQCLPVAFHFHDDALRGIQDKARQSEAVG
jgi:hypothetical protein